MRRRSLERLGLGLFASLALIGAPLPGRAADKEPVKFETFDQVEIRGSFYPGPKGTKSPCAILLHPIGGNSQLEGWDALAKKLNEELQMAVLSFDFRGHGDSTNVGKEFWVYRQNQSLRSYKPGKPKETISYKDFTTPNHIGMLTNDIAAAKRYLDKRNDSGECNSANVAIIGAESGATLGLLWIRTEWQRRRVTTGFPLVTPRSQMEGEDIACGIWLSVTSSLNVGNVRAKVNIDNWLVSSNSSVVRDKVPMMFLYGDQDATASKLSTHLVDRVLKPEKNPKLKLTGSKGIKDTKLAGRELLGKASLGTEAFILTYVKKVLEDAKNPYVKKDVGLTRLYPVPFESFMRSP
jgi:hypothetical protein